MEDVFVKLLCKVDYLRSSNAFFTNGFSSYMTAKYSDMSQMSRAIKAFI